MFNIFKKNKDTDNVEPNNIDENNSTKASITYFVDKDNYVVVDVALADYEDDSLSALMDILETLSDGKSYIETVHILKQGLIQNGKTEMLNKLAAQLASKTMKSQNGLIQKYTDIINSQPCIRPSEMLG
jgi:hypothetical protein